MKTQEITEKRHFLIIFHFLSVQVIVQNDSSYEMSMSGHFLFDEASTSSSMPPTKAKYSDTKGQRQSIGPICPICDQQMHKSHGRDHVGKRNFLNTLFEIRNNTRLPISFLAWHFVEELREMIHDPTRCPECSYVGDKLEAVTRHLALYHCKLDAFLLCVLAE